MSDWRKKFVPVPVAPSRRDSADEAFQCVVKGTAQSGRVFTKTLRSSAGMAGAFFEPLRLRRGRNIEALHSRRMDGVGADERGIFVSLPIRFYRHLKCKVKLKHSAALPIALVAGVFPGLAMPNDGVLQDPTKPPRQFRNSARATPAVRKTVAAPVLSSVLVSDDRRLAIIDQRLVAEGDAVSGHEVHRIERASVWLSKDGQRPFELRLNGYAIEKAPR